MSECSHASAARVPKGEENRGDLHGSQVSNKNSSSGLVNVSFMIIIYLMKNSCFSLRFFFFFNTENYTFKRCLIFIQNKFSNISPTQIPNSIKGCLETQPRDVQNASPCHSVNYLQPKIYTANVQFKKLLHVLLKPAGGMIDVWVTLYRNVFCSVNTCNIVQPILILCLFNKE